MSIKYYIDDNTWGNISDNAALNRMSFEEHRKLNMKMAEQHLKNAYQFDEIFNGETGVRALRFRSEMVDYMEYVHKQVGLYFDERYAVRNIKSAFKGEAKEHIRREQAKRAKNFASLLEWFDKTYDLSVLRKQLYDELINWKMPNGTAPLTIVEIYKTKVDLFNETTEVSTKDVISNTKLTTSDMITAIYEALKISYPKIYDSIDQKVRLLGQSPSNLTELKLSIKIAYNGITSMNAHTRTPAPDPTIIENNTINAIKMNNFPQLQSANDQYRFKNKQNNNTYSRSNQFNKNKTKNLTNNNNKNKFVHKFQIPLYLNNYCRRCKKWGHYASDCWRIHNVDKYKHLVDSYIKLRPKGKAATMNSIQNTVSDEIDEFEQMIIEPTNDIEDNETIYDFDNDDDNSDE